MILLDTHMWIWWVNDDPALSPTARRTILDNESLGLGVSVISCWEIAKKAASGKLQLEQSVETWIELGLRYPGVQLISLTPEVAIESTRLPGDFHRDPADQILVATSRVGGMPLLTDDLQIRSYPHVSLA